MCESSEAIGVNRGSAVRFDQLAFIENKAFASDAVLLMSSCTALITRSLFESNVATRGSAGALYAGSSSRINLVAFMR